MTGHPAHGIARMLEGAATELGGYLDPRDPFPWELTEEDHRAILPLLDRAISALSACLDGISQATVGDYAKQQLTGAKYRLVQASAGVRLAVLSYEPDEPDDVPGEEQETVTQPARLSAADFPAGMTADVLQAAGNPTAPASGPAVSARARASRPHPGSSPPR